MITCGEFSRIVDQNFTSTGRYISFDDALLEMGLTEKWEINKAKTVIVPELKDGGILRELVTSDKVRPIKRGKPVSWVFNGQWAVPITKNALVVVAKTNAEAKILGNIDKTSLSADCQIAIDNISSILSKTNTRRDNELGIGSAHTLIDHVVYWKNKYLAARTR